MLGIPRKNNKNIWMPTGMLLRLPDKINPQAQIVGYEE
jgi:hypothetical protein